MAKFVNNIKMLSKENKMLMVVLFVIALFAISGILGFTYAYFVSDALGDPQLIGIDTATLSLRYTDCSDNPDDCNNIVAKMSPGDSITKTFQVENTGTDSTTYKLYFLELLNTFVDNELVYKIERTDINRTIIGTSAIPYYETLRVNQKIYDDITISKGATHKYKITITFLNKAEGNNPVNLDAEFKIKLGIQQTGITKTNAVLVTDIFVSGNVDADLSNSKINDYTGTTINTTNVLSNSNGNSSITYQVTVYNSTRKDYTYLGTNDVSSDNNNIKYKISGINYGDKLASMSGSIFDITFYYDGNTVPSAYELNSEIEFIFEQAYIVTYSNISGDYPTIVYANVPLEIDLSSTGYDTFEVYQGTTKLTELLNYNVDGKKLNIFNVSGNIEIRGVTNICAKNNITNLGDCLIAADQNTTDINAAKTNIKNTRTLTSYPQEPKIIYEEKIEYDEWLGAAYIDSSTDNPTLMFSTEPPIYSSSSRTWKLKSGTTFIGNFTDYVSNETNKYYTCLNTSGACSTAYVYYSIQIVKGENSVYRCFVRNADVYTEQISGSSISNPGLYYAEDDYGDSYYYRGAVRNNYVNFAGFLWRIVRINGDNSIRLVKETNISVSTNPNAKTVIDPATVGYTYKLDRTFKTIPEEGSVTISLNSSSDYYYGTEYTYDYDKSVWTISGYKTNGTFYDKANQILNGDSTSGNIPYKYTCLSTSENGTCHYIYEIVDTVQENSTISKTKAKVKYHEYSSSSYEATYGELGNNDGEIDSSAKYSIDTWFKNNLLYWNDSNNKNYEDYLADTLFCNDRRISSGNGYNVYASTSYISSNTLKCARQIDQYTVNIDNEKNIGNGKLTYPIAMLTKAEVVMAGGVYRVSNGLYYLNNGTFFTTMTPSWFGLAGGFGRTHIFHVYAEGLIYDYNAGWSGNRPVINLSSNVKISGGNGSASSPFEVTI